MLDQCKQRWDRRKKIRFDQKHLEARARRFLEDYLAADDAEKPKFYQAVEDISKKCYPTNIALLDPDIDDAKVAELTSAAAIEMVRDHDFRLRSNDPYAHFVTDASAAVAIAYRRAAGVYVADAKMRELGTAAVHLLTMATSYIKARSNDQRDATQTSQVSKEVP